MVADIMPPPDSTFHGNKYLEICLPENEDDSHVSNCL
jgi:hypothetical protein